GCKACPRHRKSLLAPSQAFLSGRRSAGQAGVSGRSAVTVACWWPRILPPGAPSAAFTGRLHPLTSLSPLSTGFWLVRGDDGDGGAGGCLRPLGAQSLLLVTSDFHPRRALSSFHRGFPDLKVSVAAVDRIRFGVVDGSGVAKNTVYEWMGLA